MCRAECRCTAVLYGRCIYIRNKTIAVWCSYSWLGDFPVNGIGSKLFSFVLRSYFTQGVVKPYGFIRPGSVSFPVHPKGAGWSWGQCSAQPKQVLSEAPFVCVALSCLKWWWGEWNVKTLWTLTSLMCLNYGCMLYHYALPTLCSCSRSIR